MKFPISVLCRMMTKLIVYLDDMLLFGQILEETLMARDTVFFSHGNVGFHVFATGFHYKFENVNTEADPKDRIFRR